MTLEKLIAYFHGSRFDYLALDFAGVSLRLARNEALSAAQSVVHEVLAPSVGFMEPAAGRDRFPTTGTIVAEGEPLFTLRRFRDTIEVKAPGAGTLGVVATQGAFVQYGECIAAVKRA
jgi:biotin carboxyl carrier protein